MGEHENDPCMMPDGKPDPEVIAGTAAPASQDMPPPRKGSGKRVAVAVAAALALVAVALVAFFSWSFLPIPEVLGRDPLDATATVASASERWRTELVFEDGSSADKIGEGEAGDYEVRAVEPVQGSRLNRLSDAVVVLTVAKTDEALAREEAEREAAEEEARKAAEEKAAAEAKARRDEIAEREIADSLESGWASEEYVDGESYMLFKVYDDDRAASDRLFAHWGLHSSDDPSEELYENMAAEAQADIVVGCYTEDGFLYSVYYKPFSGSSEEQLRASAIALGRILSEAEDFATENREAYLDELVDLYIGYYGCSNAEYSIYGDEVVFYVYSQHSGDRVHWPDDSPSEFEDILRRKQTFAHDMSLFTNADVTTRYCSKDGYPFTNGSTFTATRQSSE